MTSRLGRAAVWYAKHYRWAVLPLHTVDADGRCSCGLRDCGSPGKHPRHPQGSKAATRDVSTLAAWWAHKPDSNVGIATGSASGLVVLDIDPPKGGNDTFNRLTERHGRVPPTVVGVTGGKGRHLVYQHAGDDIRNRAGMGGPGLDVRGEGGYIVAPPSLHQSGNTYEWHVEWRPDKKRPAPLSGWLLDYLRKVRHMPGAGGTDLAKVLRHGVGEGQRDQTLARISGVLLSRGIPYPVALDLLLAWNRTRCRPPLPDRQVEKVARSISRYHSG